MGIIIAVVVICLVWFGIYEIKHYRDYKEELENYQKGNKPKATFPYYYESPEWDNSEIAFGISVAVISGGLIGLILSFLAVLLPIGVSTEHHSVPLVSLHDGTSVRGSFFLASGNIDSIPSYTFYVKEGDYFNMHTSTASTAHIVYDKNPLVTYTCKIGNSWISVLNLDDRANCNIDNQELVIHVPAGTIKTSMVLDAK